MGEGCIIRGLQAVFRAVLSNRQNERYMKVKSASVQESFFCF